MPAAPKEDGPSSTMGQLISEQRAERATSIVPLSRLDASVVQGKTVLITGANTGLGREAARHYYRLGTAHIILGVRTVSKGEAAKADIEANPINPLMKPEGQKEAKKLQANVTQKPRISVWQVDLESFASIRAFAARVNSELDGLDIALMNAGVHTDQMRLTADGWEISNQVNAIGTILLGALLLPKLRVSARPGSNLTPHLSFVVSRLSETHAPVGTWQDADKPLVALNDLKVAKGMGARYGISKLMLTYAVRELAARVDGRSVVVTCADPGPSSTDLSREADNSFFLKMIGKVFVAMMGRTAEEGSRTFVLATLLEDKEHGKWIDKNKMKEYALNITGKSGTRLSKKVWAEITEVLRANGVDESIVPA